MPIANYLHQQGAKVYICASGSARSLMQMECIYAVFVEDVPFEVTYSKNKTVNWFKLIAQLPKMLLQVYQEHQLLKKIVHEHQIDMVISDNRYGFYHAHIFSVFITHQLQIKVPFAAQLVNSINHYFINKFNVCWVPDFESSDKSLAGELSRNKTLKHVQYIGPLSRANESKNIEDKNASVLYLVSGVEPQRTIFEKIIIQYHTQNAHKAILIRGTTHSNNRVKPKENLIVYDMCDAKQLQSLISACKYVVCRSGYSSIMDLINWKKDAVLVPTPGQNEQEYLAEYLANKKWFYSINQIDFLKFNEVALKDFKCPGHLTQTHNYDQLFSNFK